LSIALTQEDIMNGLSPTNLDYLARMQIAQRTNEAKARRLSQTVRRGRTGSRRRPTPNR
jgi:hypothetical protein